jgi:N-acyl-D-aspartate/D-glutamate deacylase
MKRLIPLACLLCAPAFGQTYDLVLSNGRVMDPESGLDATRNVGINGSRIVAVSAERLQGRTTIDATGLVVTAGFIDLHSHGQSPENHAYKARDGVTTALELEVGVSPVASWYAAPEGKALVNFGATSGHIPARIAVMHDTGDLLPRDAAVTQVATPEQRASTLDLVRRGLDEGGLGIGLGIAYTPTATRQEILELFELAAQRRVPVFVHLRSNGPVVPGAIDSLQEVLADAAATGAGLHVVHVTSMGLRETPVLLRMIAGARARGLDVTTEAYPYTAAMTDLSSSVFSDGWQERNGGIDYGDLQWALTGERLTADTFARYRKQGGMTIIHSIPEEMAQLAMADPTVIVASDGLLQNGKGHPRGAGTFSRVLGHYVREQRALTLMDALRKMSLMPAQRLGIQSKGRLQAGADADITVFDPERVTDRATFDNPGQYSEGIPFVVVNGKLAVKDGRVVNGIAPGVGLRR